MKEIVWKPNNNGGETAFVGKIKIGSYWHNAIDPKEGNYRLSTFMPQATIQSGKAFFSDVARAAIETEFNNFIRKLSE